ncbi:MULTISPECIES: DUF2179 domain-containing protein [Bacillaceae]|uniref:DUF2179 domain-containing protein n=1 Tax=Bacillaceae TaxID=186817 RepID=UPI000A2AB073|nr:MULTISPECIES: DUF2179 domain-containing protein [unclassified Bacillus (in: firmicutes)]MBT2695928.1 DUF2179 domain-containing protein [Bacillus sp. ISL-40]MBT2722771.1 DUF2179 domain-containing protein [Bacillus sp. ISL-46]MBT2739716.1 DUF2179 domain-containing protein [Bacillus sp. ISL-77]PGY12081.1 DUF2179 domain-containing protein [Bacillus sp. AFS031507]SMQ84896.1 Uncharacterized protein YebE, UPF0316 family [Bacillus sp. OV166]
MKEILLILLLQLIYVPIYTLRTIFLVKNITVLASILGIAEMLIYVFGLSLVFGGDQSFVSMVVYAVGFGLGIILGTKLEQKIAIGYINVTVNTQEKNSNLIDTLRQNGFGVTLYTGEGRDSERYRMEILTKRNRENELIATVEMFEPSAFIISYEPRRFKGGFLLDRLR